ncbi:MAG TPA: pyrroline-5-carboxylate reductase [Burkholderiaceae bacterium]|nr:pyrroline-5-carboxylate reductase [Burkholderiaceae bacterium]
MNTELSLAFIGGGNMATALATGLIGTHCTANNVHVVDIDPAALQRWREKGATVAAQPDNTLTQKRIWVLSVKPQFLEAAVAACKPYLQPNTLVISVAAGIPAATLSHWLGSETQPFTRLVRCMPNTPALIGAGVSGLYALEGVTQADAELAHQLLSAVGQVVWVNSDAQIDAVTALSGSGPAYVFLFLQSLIEGAIELGLSPEQARTLALATVDGATRLAGQSDEDLATLRQRVTSKGGTTAAALAVFEEQGFASCVNQAMRAAKHRAAQLAEEFSK